jgi:hypothetical protein
VPKSIFDLPLDEFYGRTKELRLVLATVEAARRSAGTLTTSRTRVDFADLGNVTVNTTTAMALVFLASSFEEFVREQISQCGSKVSVGYRSLNPDTRATVRDAYWKALLERIKRHGSILTKTNPRTPDIALIAQLRALLDSASGFVIEDNATKLDQTVFYQHARNFRPHVVDEIASRVGVKGLMASAADTAKLKTYFGVAKKSDCALKLKTKLDDFYRQRNEIVHSLKATSGNSVDTLFDYIQLFEDTAESISRVLAHETAKW